MLRDCSIWRNTNADGHPGGGRASGWTGTCTTSGLANDLAPQEDHDILPLIHYILGTKLGVFLRIPHSDQFQRIILPIRYLCYMHNFLYKMFNPDPKGQE